MTKLTISIEFEIGQIVYLVTDKDQQPNMVIGLRVVPGQVLYHLEDGCYAYAFQLTLSPSITFAN